MAHVRIKVLYISGTRADFGLMKGVLDKLRKDKRFELKIVATGMHLMDEFGYTIKDIEQEKYTIIKIKEAYKEDNRWSMAKFVGRAAWRFAEVFKQENPDCILLLGDRGEMLAGAIAATYGGIPIAQLHGGEVTGSIDEPVRHAITKLAHLHLAPTTNAAKRIIKMGEPAWRVHWVGAPSLDTIMSMQFPSRQEIQKQFHLDQQKPCFLVVQHPVITEYEQCSQQMRETMETIKALGQQTIVIYPNADAGGRSMIDVIRQYESLPIVQIYKSLPYETYLGLLNTVDVLIGNSSSGIIESPSFKLPVVNIGTRQNGREQSTNIISCMYSRVAIKKAILNALSKSFKSRIKKCKNVYGDGKAGERVINILSMMKGDRHLLQKKNAY